MGKSKEKAKSSKPSQKWEMIKEGRKICPNCGKGVYLGKYTNPNRYHCGKCSYTEFF
ncbi:MAG: 30S ribosomal protein S27ae [Candidatus Woesearchaeota archaeon]